MYLDMNETANIAENRLSDPLMVLLLWGFVILVGAGIWLAVYSTRYVPTVVNRISAAAVYFGSLFLRRRSYPFGPSQMHQQLFLLVRAVHSRKFHDFKACDFDSSKTGIDNCGGERRTRRNK